VGADAFAAACGGEGQEQVQRLQGAPPEHVMPPALVSDDAQPLLHSRHEHAGLLPSMPG
jgi:hypothetical protein